MTIYSSNDDIINLIFFIFLGLFALMQRGSIKVPILANAVGTVANNFLPNVQSCTYGDYSAFYVKEAAIH